VLKKTRLDPTQSKLAVAVLFGRLLLMVVLPAALAVGGGYVW